MRRPGGLSLFLAATLSLTLVTIGWFWANQDVFAPNTLPWKPVVLDAPPRWLAHWQLYRLGKDAGLCRAALKTATQLRVTPLDDRRIKDECVFQNVVRADESPVRFSPRVTATCGVTAALYWYQRQLAQAAQTHMHSRLVGITQLGTYACRNVNNLKEGRLSQHATANAIDLAAFHFSDGRNASVLRDYGKPTPQGRFLDAAHEQACELFNVVLGPRYNRLHADHFHLDMGGFLMCR